MKKIFIIMTALMLLQNTAYASPFDVMMGASTVGGMVTSAVVTKNIVENSNKTTAAVVRNIDAQTENIKNNGGLQILRQPDGTAKVYKNGVEVKSTVAPNSPEYKMGLSMATSITDYMERKNAQAKLKQIKAVAKIEKDTKTLGLIKKYKKAGAIVTLEKIKEQEGQKK